VTIAGLRAKLDYIAMLANEADFNRFPDAESLLVTVISLADARSLLGGAA
jgi:hypothetical protein